MDGIPGPDKNVIFIKNVFVLRGLIVVLRILLSKCLNPKLRNNDRFIKETLSEIVNWRALFLRNGFASETYSGPTWRYSNRKLLLA
jgi:hypothetical protein